MTTRRKWSQLLHNLQSHCLQTWGERAGPERLTGAILSISPHIAHNSSYISHNFLWKQTKKHLKTGSATRCTEQRRAGPLGRTWKRPRSRQKSHPWLDSHGPTVGTGHNIGASPWGRKRLNTAHQTTQLLRSTCEKEALQNIGFWKPLELVPQDPHTCGNLRRFWPAPARGLTLTGPAWKHQTGVSPGFVCLRRLRLGGALAWRQETYLTPTCGPTGMTSAGQPDGLAAIFACFQAVNSSSRRLVRMSGVRFSARPVFRLVAGLVWSPVLRLVPCLCGCR